MTLTEIINTLEKETCYECSYGCQGMISCENDKCRLKQAVTEAVRSLNEYRDSRKLIFDGRLVSYWGRLPVIKRGAEYYAVHDYVPKHEAWRCHRLTWDNRLGEWSCRDDDNYIIDKNGTLICKEVGWNLTEVYPPQRGEK